MTWQTVTHPDWKSKPSVTKDRDIAAEQKHLQVGSLALLHVFALAAGGCFLAAECARDAHQQAAMTQEKAADVHHHEQQQQRSQAQAHHRPQPKAAEQGFC